MIVVAVDLLFIVPGVVGGSEDYSTALLRSFAANQPDDIELRLFAQEALPLAHPDLATMFEIETVSLNATNKPARVLAENTWFERASRRHGADVQHHFGGRLPALARGPQILTIHDLQPLDQPHNFGVVKRRFLQRAIPRSVARADRVVTVSDAVRDQVVDRFAIDAEHVVSIASGLGPAPDDVAETPAGLPQHYVVYPAVSHPHKNHGTILEAIAELRRRGVEQHLVLVGGAGAAAREVEGLIRTLGIDDLVHHLGRVDRATVDALLRRADAMVFPSRYEGFGLPVLEAFRAQTPAVVADVEPLRSLVAGAAQVVDPDDPAAWADALQNLEPADPTAMQGVLDRFSPASRASLLVDLYRSVGSEYDIGG